MSQVFEVGRHRHINGDSTKTENYSSIMQSESAKMIYADPPFCLLVRRNKKTGKLRDPKKAKINHEAVRRFENVKEYRRFTRDWMEPASKFLSDDGVFVVWTNFLGKQPIHQVAKDLGLNEFHGEFLWGKLSRETSGNEVNARVYEVALVFSKKPLAELENNSKAHPWSVITRYDEEKEASLWGDHPNHKPFSCLEPLIRNYTNPGDIILDPFTGSGSTPAASIQLGRVIRGIELRENWALMSQKRIKEISDRF